jgi:hypothetical protein
MKIEHIIWEEWNYTDKKVFGILELDIHYHGGGTDRVIMQGTYINMGRGMFANQFVTIDEDTMGVSNVSLLRIGTIAE